MAFGAIVWTRLSRHQKTNSEAKWKMECRFHPVSYLLASLPLAQNVGKIKGRFYFVWYLFAGMHSAQNIGEIEELLLCR